jgi:hypothetical protein
MRRWLFLKALSKMNWNKKIQLLIGSLFCLSVSVANSQYSNDDIDNYNNGMYQLSIDEFKNASKYFAKLTDKYPDNAKLNYLAGCCYLNIKTEETKAIPYFKKAVSNIDTRYSDIYIDGEGAPPEAWLYMGDAYHQTGQLEEASFAYHKYLDYLDKKSDTFQETIRRIEGLGASYDAVFRPSGFVLEPMPAGFNSEYSDYDPVVSGDKQTMAFTSHREPTDKIFISYLENGEWAKPIDITAQVGSKDDFFTTALSYDGTDLYMIKYDPYNSDIFVSHKTNGQWSKMVPLGNPINTDVIETGASVSTLGDTLYFCSNRTGGYGGVDAYYSVRKNNKWTKPVNLGKSINTLGDECVTRISTDGKTLFVCSNGYETIGGIDIFYSKRDSLGGWQTPVRFPVTINTPNDDMSFYFNNDRKTGYISRMLEGTTNRDIFKIKYNEPDSNELKKSLEVDESLSDNSSSGIKIIKPGTEQAVARDNSGLSDTNSVTNETNQQQAESALIAQNANTNSVNDNANLNTEQGIVQQSGNNLQGVQSGTKNSGNQSNNSNIQEEDKEFQAKNKYSATENNLSDGEKDIAEKEGKVGNTDSKTEVGQNLQRGNNLLKNQTTNSQENSKENNKLVSTQNQQINGETNFSEKETKSGENSNAKNSSTKTVITSRQTSQQNSEAETKTSETRSKSGEGSIKTKIIPKSTFNEEVFDPKGAYTIQVMALLNPHDARIFSKLNKKYFYQSYGSDGFCRYSYGRYPSIEKAKPDLEKVEQLGFSDAFIRNIKEIDNFNGKR